MRVVVVGGGASGCFASMLIAEKGHEVILLEKNEKLGKKLYITGKGRCNLTNVATGNLFLSNVVNNAKFIMSSEIRFNSSDTRAYFENLGVPLKVERGDRVFPVSDKASDITRAMEKRMKELKVKIMLNTEVKGIISRDGTAAGVKLKDNTTIGADAVIVATGGMTYQLTGSTGDGYKFAKAVGHKVIEPVAALSAILLNDKDLKNLSGLSLKNVTIRATSQNKIIYQSPIGEMLFTAAGISGPIVLSLSSYINRILPQNIVLTIDFKPALNDFALSERINRDIEKLKAKQFSSLLAGLLPQSLVDVFAKRLNIAKSKKVNQISHEEREALVRLLKNFKLDYKGLDNIDRAVITSGGVCVKEIKPKSMESKLIKRLYFIGEVLDVDALTGGFNLQIAFSTAASCASDF